MPSKLYDCKTETYFSSVEEQKKERKRRDNIAQKIRYWRKKYGYDINTSDYDEFNKYVHIIKKVHNLHDFIIMYNEKNNFISKEHMDIYGQNYHIINQGLEIKPYLKTLKKITTDKGDKIEDDVFIIDNW